MSPVTPAFWRKWHRWIGFPASIFLLFAAVTGVIVAFTEFFGEEEALREATRELVSPMTVQAPAAAWEGPLRQAITVAAREAGNAPVDEIRMQFKGDRPTVTLFLGKPTGGEDRKVVVNAKTGALIGVEAYTDKPFIHRLHSGEGFGDGGLVMSMLWGLSLVALTVTGFIIYWRMRRAGAVGLKRVFW